MIVINSIYPPALAELGGKLYAVPSWTEVPKGTTLSMLKWNKPAQVKVEVVTKHVGKYIINIYTNGKVTCDCPGFTYRRKCKHSAEYLV